MNLEKIVFNLNRHFVPKYINLQDKDHFSTL